MKNFRVSLDKLRITLLKAYCSYRTGESGVSAVEYALIVVAVIAIVGVGITILGDGFQNLFEELNSEMGKAVSATMKAAGTS